jgi:MFS family permease
MNSSRYDVADVPATDFSYRRVMTLPGWWRWATVTLAGRTADAGTPLVLVLFGRYAAHYFAVGGLMSGAYAIAEAVAAPWLGARLGARPAHRPLMVTLALRGALFLALPLAAAVVPVPALIAMVALAGAVAAGTPGSLRALLARLADGTSLHKAITLDTLLLELAWVVAPGLIGALAGWTNPRLAVLTIAILNVLAAVGARWLPLGHPSEPASATPRMSISRLRPAAVSLRLGVLAGLVGGALDTAIPPRLVEAGSAAAAAGILFTGYSIASLAGGLAYGARRWPGSPQRQAELLLIADVLVMLPAARPGTAGTSPQRRWRRCTSTPRRPPTIRLTVIRSGVIVDGSGVTTPQ